MSFYTEMMKRASLYKLSEYIIYGDEGMEEGCVWENKTYKERIDGTINKVIEKIREKYPEMKEYENIMEYVFECIKETKKVYMEIGIKCGFKLTFEMLGNIPRIEREIKKI